MRVRIFVDFWNFQLGWNDYHRKKGAPQTVKIPWASKLPAVICAAVGESALYAGTHVYASTNPKNPNDSGLRKFLNVLDGFPGYSVVVKDRKPASKIRCPECKQLV